MADHMLNTPKQLLYTPVLYTGVLPEKKPLQK